MMLFLGASGPFPRTHPLLPKTCSATKIMKMNTIYHAPLISGGYNTLQKNINYLQDKMATGTASIRTYRSLRTGSLQIKRRASQLVRMGL